MNHIQVNFNVSFIFIETHHSAMSFTIAHLTVACLVAKPLKRSEAKFFKCKLLYYHAN